MLDIINIGTSSLLGHSKGLRVVSNNLANVNTIGFKSSQMHFGNLFDQNANGATSGNYASSGFGNGVSVIGTTINFKAGAAKETNQAGNLRISGDGFFAVKRDDKILFTRDGGFLEGQDGILINSITKDRVQSFENGQLADIDLSKYQTISPKATSEFKITGKLPNSPVNATTELKDVTVIDVNGNTHKFRLVFVLLSASEVEVKISQADSTTQETLGKFRFGAGSVLGNGKLQYFFRPKDTSDLPLTFDFSELTQPSNDPGQVSVASQDGYLASNKTGFSIDKNGLIKISYQNKETVDGPRIALANFGLSDDLQALSRGMFELKPGASAQYGNPGENGLGEVEAGIVEASNVDLAEEFGNLILMQRGYQAASHVISTANDMIQGLFDMKGNR